MARLDISGADRAERPELKSDMLRKMPTAIFAVTDDFAHSIHFLLEQRGLRVPEDISLVGLGDIDRKGPFISRLTSVVIDGAEMGRRAVKMLGEMQSGNRGLHDTENIAVSITLSAGQTLGPASVTPHMKNS